MLLDGEWSAHEGGYGLKLGTVFLGEIRQRGGDGIRAPTPHARHRAALKMQKDTGNWNRPVG